MTTRAMTRTVRWPAVVLFSFVAIFVMVRTLA